jgi:hypothetical protein
MIIPAIEEGLTAITVIFHKPLAEWTADDQAVIIQRLREFFDRKTGKRRRRKARVDPRQIDIEDLIAKDKGEADEAEPLARGSITRRS